MADDLIVTDEVLNDPLVLARLLRDIIERLGDDVDSVNTQTIINRVIQSGGGGSAIVVKDEGVSLTTGLLELDFVGDGVEVTTVTAGKLLVTISTGAILPASTEYCPNYTYVYVSDTSWKVEGYDVTNIFSPAKRLKFTLGSTIKYGTVVSSSFSTDTTIVMSMESSAVLTDDAIEVCLVSNTAGWAPISTLPLGAVSINAVATGKIGSSQYWIIVADGGKIATSTDAGLTWTEQTSGTTENLNCIAYNSTDEVFMIGADNATILTSSNGSTWVVDTTVLAATMVGSPTGNVLDIAYGYIDNSFNIRWDGNSTGSGYELSYTNDEGATWTGPRLGQTSRGIALLDSVDDIFFGYNNDVYIYINQADTTASITVTCDAATGNVTSLLFFSDGTEEWKFIGHSNGMISYQTPARGLFEDITPPSSNPIRGMAYSSFHDRVVAVGDNATIVAIEYAARLADDGVVAVANGFSPLENINDIAWNSTDGFFIAVGAFGNVARSTNGLV